MTKKLKLILSPVFMTAISVLLIQGCVPVFSDLQSARMAGAGNFELTASGSVITSTNSEGIFSHQQNEFGFQGAYGITPDFDARVRYEYIRVEQPGISQGFHVVGFGPKVSVVEDHIAFLLPMGRAFGDNADKDWQIHPTLLLTLPIVKDKLDFNVSPKYLMRFCEGCDNLVAVNLGLSISDSDIDRWSLRPEYGMLFNPGRSGYNSHFSLGLVFKIPRKEKEEGK